MANENHIVLGYSNYCFDLWLVLHKKEYDGTVQNQDGYADVLRSVYGLEPDANIKKEKRVRQIVDQIDLQDVKLAIHRAESIADNNKNKNGRDVDKAAEFIKKQSVYDGVIVNTSEYI